MLDCSYELQKRYFDVLSSIPFTGIEVGIYDNIVPKDAVEPYIVFQGNTIVEDSTKSSFGSEVYLNFQIFVKSANQYGGRRIMYAISSAVVSSLRVLAKDLNNTLGSDFNLILLEVDSLSDSILMVEDGIVIVRNMRFKNLVRQINI